MGFRIGFFRSEMQILWFAGSRIGWRFPSSGFPPCPSPFSLLPLVLYLDRQGAKTGRATSATLSPFACPVPLKNDRSRMGRGPLLLLF